MRTDADKLEETVALLKIMARNKGITIHEGHDNSDIDRSLLLTRAMMYGWSSVTI